MSKFHITLAQAGGDKILFIKIKNKDRQAFVKAYDLYADQLFRFIYFKTGSKEEAEDLTSAVFLKVWDYIQEGNLIEYKTLKSLLYKVARNSIIDYYRKNSGREKISLDDPDKNLDIADEKNNLIKQAETASDFSNLENKLLQLKDEYREVIALRFVDELTISEIAVILNKSKGNVRVLIFRAIEALKKLVD